MAIPRTVTTALADRPVAGAVCLEAGAGVGNTTAGLLAGGASRVYAVTNERKHAKSTLERVRANADLRTDSPGRVAILEADLRDIPLPADSVEVITAHGLFNVVPPADLAPIITELTRVAAPAVTSSSTTTSRCPTTPPLPTCSHSRTRLPNSLTAVRCSRFTPRRRCSGCSSAPAGSSTGRGHCSSRCRGPRPISRPTPR